MIATLCANAGMDKTYQVASFDMGEFHHPDWSYTGPGGKGINVARVLDALGHHPIVTGFVGGHIGEYITDTLEHDGIDTRFVGVDGESRLCINIIDPAADVRTRLDEDGPTVGAGTIAKLKQVWRQLLDCSELMTISGSTPPGAPAGLYGELIKMAHETDVPVILDAHDEPLKHAIAASPTIVKPNIAELAELFGRELTVPDGVVAACKSLIGRGVQTVVCSLGADGAIAVTEGGNALRGHAPAIKAVSPVGAGDAMVAGIAGAYVAGKGLSQQLCLGMAAGAACAARRQASDIERQQVFELADDVRVEQLDS